MPVVAGPLTGTFQSGLGGSDPLILRFEPDPGTFGTVTAMELFGPSSATAVVVESTNLYLAGESEPITISHNEDGWPVRIQGPDGTTLEFVYGSTTVDVHFLLATGEFGVETVPLTAGMLATLDRIRDNTAANRGGARRRCSRRRSIAHGPRRRRAHHHAHDYFQHHSSWNSHWRGVLSASRCTTCDHDRRVSAYQHECRDAEQRRLCPDHADLAGRTARRSSQRSGLRACEDRLLPRNKPPPTTPRDRHRQFGHWRPQHRSRGLSRSGRARGRRG